MADGYDRFENEGSGGGSFVMGLLTGTVLGAGLGMLFAPKSGSELRNQISEQAGSLANTASDGYKKASETAGEWADRGRDMYDKARDAVARGAEEAQRYVRDTASTISGGASATPSTGTTSGPGFSSGPSYGSTMSSEGTRSSASEPTRPGASDTTRGSRRS
jgi:gas vesicle protein